MKRLERLKTLRDLREQRARSVLAAANAELDEGRRRFAAAIETIHEREEDFRRDDRTALAGLLDGDNADSVLISRLRLRHHIGQEAIREALRAAHAEKTAVADLDRRAQETLGEWKTAALRARKMELLVGRATMTRRENERS